MILMNDNNPNPLTNVRTMKIIVTPFIVAGNEYIIPTGGKEKQWTINPTIPDLTAEVLSVSDEGIVIIEFSDPLYLIPNIQVMIDEAKDNGEELLNVIVYSTYKKEF